MEHNQCHKFLAWESFEETADRIKGKNVPMPQPVALLLRQSLSLKTEVLDCLSDPAPKHVHHLRSKIRRIEATLELLALSASLPDLHKEAKPLTKLLTKIRRAAGKVRDLDVHLDLLKKYRRNDDTARLEKDLASARKKNAAKLRDLLKKDRLKVDREFDRLQIALEPALNLAIGGDALEDVAHRWFAFSLRGLDHRKDKHLHTIRKVSKTARYLAEIGAETSKAAARSASRFERTQQALGKWHDSLLLGEEASASLGKRARTTQQIQSDTQRLRQRAIPTTRHLPKASQIAPRYLLH